MSRTSEPHSVPSRSDPDPRGGADAFARAVLASIGAHICVVDRDGVIVATNPAWDNFAHENCGPGVGDGDGNVRRTSAFRGTNYIDVCDRTGVSRPGDGHDVARGLRDVIAGRADRFSLEYPCHSPTEQRWFFLQATPLLLDDGEIGGAVISHVNITDRKRAELRLAKTLADLRAQQARIDDLIENVPGVVWETQGPPTGHGQRVTFVSRHFETMTGYGVDEWIARPDFWLSIVDPLDRDRAQREMAAIYAGGHPGSSQFRWVRKDGTVIWVEAHASVIAGELGGPAGLRGVTMDISERKSGEDALRRHAREMTQLARELKRSNAELDQFAYVTSHDLKAPLRGIANLSRWIEEDLGDRFTPEAHRLMNLLRGRVHRMEALIDGLLAYSRIGRTTLKVDTLDVGQLLREVVELLDPPPEFVVEIGPGMPTLQTSRVALQQVFANLVSNALRHHGGRQGRVAISAVDGGPNFYEFRVADDGQGIAPEFHEKIFEIFQKLEARDKVEGTGIGLALVKKTVERFGGAVRVESAPGRGATFAFLWPKSHATARDGGTTPGPVTPAAPDNSGSSTPSTTEVR